MRHHDPNKGEKAERIGLHNRVGVAVDVFMEGYRCLNITRPGVPRLEAVRGRVVVAGAQVDQAQVHMERFFGVSIFGP